MLLQRRPKQKAADLAAELGVSERTLHRYITNLDEMGIPIYSERGPHGGFSLVRGYKMPPLVFTPEEAVAVHLGAHLVDELWGELYAEAVQGALAKLENVLPDDQRQEVAWAQRSLIAIGMNRSEPEDVTPFLATLRHAMHESLCVEMVYQGRRQDAPVKRLFAPYALVHRWGWWYVVGHCHLRESVRTFRVDRVQALISTQIVFERPATFDVHAYLATNDERQSLITVRMRFSPQGAHLARHNQSYWTEMEEEADGSIVVAITVPTFIWGASTVMSYGGLAEALDPPEVRKMVHEWAQAIVSDYEEDTSQKPS